MADLTLNQAAELLGLTPQRLEELAGTGDIHATKTDNGYTFNQNEVERFADMNGITLGSGADGDEYNLTDADADSVLVDGAPVSSASGGSGPIIGAEGGSSPHDSDLKLSDSLELELDEGDELSLDLGEGDIDQDDKTQFAVGGDFNFDEQDEFSLDLDEQGEIDSEDKTHFAVGADALDVNTEDELSLDLGGGSEDDTQFGMGDLNVGEDELSLDLGASTEGDTQFAIGDSADFKVGEDDLVLGGDDSLMGSGAESSDISLASDSGVNIGSPQDSGISLEGAVDLAGDSSISLELPDAGDVQADEEFMLGGTPDNDMSDSGSQVIAISDSAAFGDDAATMVAPDGGVNPFAQQPAADPFAAQPAVDPFAAQPAGDPFGAPVTPDPFAAAAPMGTPDGFDESQGEPMMESEMLAEATITGPPLQEATYGFFNVMSLFMIFLVQLSIVFLMMDVVRNIWSLHDETPKSVSGYVVKMFAEFKNGTSFKTQPWLWPSVAFGVFFIVIIVGWILDRGKRK